MLTGAWISFALALTFGLVKEVDRPEPYGAQNPRPRFLAGGPTATVSGGPFTALVHLHGALFTGWVLLFITQTALVASHRVAVHRRLGVAGAALAAAMVVAGTSVAIATAKRGAAPVGVTPLGFLAIPIFDMVVFSTLVATALAMRRDKETHKRLMLLAFISIVVAAVARLPGMLPRGPLAFFGAGYLFVVVAVAYDLVYRADVRGDNRYAARLRLEGGRRSPFRP